jgi:tRNA(Met) C34 N-acetyltransferase TmcA
MPSTTPNADDLSRIAAEQEQRIKLSGIRNIFTPHRPIKSATLFAGRQPQVRSIGQALDSPGQHVVLYGDRGVGKSSLATVVTMLHGQQFRGESYDIRCDSMSTFESVLSLSRR